MHKHKRDEVNPQRVSLLKQWREYKDKDGLNSLVYKVCCFFDLKFNKMLSKMFYNYLQINSSIFYFYNNL